LVSTPLFFFLSFFLFPSWFICISCKY
jgi:hypothetical protein